MKFIKEFKDIEGLKFEINNAMKKAEKYGLNEVMVEDWVDGSVGNYMPEVFYSAIGYTARNKNSTSKRYWEEYNEVIKTTSKDVKELMTRYGLSNEYKDWEFSVSYDMEDGALGLVMCKRENIVEMERVV